MDSRLVKNRLLVAMTLVETLVSMVIMVIVFAAVVPQIRCIQNSWASKRGNAEVIQNARALMDHITFNLTKAKRVTAVSSAAETNGYIEFEDNDNKTMRYEIGANNYVQFGRVDDLSDLAGPVSQLQFTCYNASDLDTAITDVNYIRTVQAEATFTNAAALGRDHTFTAQAHLRTNYDADDMPEIHLLEQSTHEFNVVLGQEPALAQIDDDYYLCAYAGPGEDGWAVVVVVDTDAWTVSRETPFEYDNTKGASPALAQIDNEHYLCAYNGAGDDGFAVILTVDTGNWTITKGTTLEFDNQNGQKPALVQVDADHYLCVYQGKHDDGWAVVFAVDTGTETVTVVDSFEFETKDCHDPVVRQIDSRRYLCVYEGSQNDGWVTVLDVNPGNYTISKLSSFEYDAVAGKTPGLYKIDDEHYLCAYSGISDNGYAVVLTVQSGTWNISKATPLMYEGNKAITPDLIKVNDDEYLCVYEGPSLDAWANMLAIDPNDWTITAGTRVEYDPVGGETPCLAKVDIQHFLVVFQGANNDGWAGILEFGVPLRP